MEWSSVMPTPDQLLLNKAKNPVIKQITDAALVGVQMAAAKPTNGMDSAAVAGAVVNNDLPISVANAVASNPVVQHLTNTEKHWWQQRTKWAFIVSMALVLLKPGLHAAGYDVSEGMQDWIVTALSSIGDLAAGLLALRAGQTLKPLFPSASKNLPFPLNRG